MAQTKVIGRREFLSVTAIAGTTLALEAAGNNLAEAAGLVLPKIDVKTATSATFKPLIGQTFQVSGSKKGLKLEEVKVVVDRNRSKRPRGIRQESFLLLFTAPQDVQLSDGIYTLTTRTRSPFAVYMIKTCGANSVLTTGSILGQVENYLTAVSKNLSSNAARTYYQAAFS